MMLIGILFACFNIVKCNTYTDWDICFVLLQMDPYFYLKYFLYHPISAIISSLRLVTHFTTFFDYIYSPLSD